MKKLLSFLILIFSLQTLFGQIESDKALHFLGGNLYGLVGAGVASELSDGNRTWTFVGSVGGSLLIGLAKESIDENQYGGWDNGDLLATVLGGIAVGATIDIFKKRKQQKREQLFKDALKSANAQNKIPVNTEKINSLYLLGFSEMVLNR